MFIYVIVCSESLKLYVGQHKGENLQKYLHQKISHALRHEAKGSALYNAMRVHPKESWSIWPLVSGIESRAELDELEKHFIRVLKAQCKEVGYNICRGGEGFSGPHSEASKQKMRDAVSAYYAAGGPAGMTGKTHTTEWKAAASIRAQAYRATDETKQQISQSLMGHAVSEETRRKQSEAKIGKIAGDQNPFFGKHHSDEANRKNAEAHRGRKWTDEQKQKFLAAISRPEVKAKMRVGLLAGRGLKSEETRRKIGEANRRASQNPETKARMRLAALAREAQKRKAT